MPAGWQRLSSRLLKVTTVGLHWWIKIHLLFRRYSSRANRLCSWSKITVSSVFKSTEFKRSGGAFWLCLLSSKCESMYSMTMWAMEPDGRWHICLWGLVSLGNHVLLSTLVVFCQVCTAVRRYALSLVANMFHLHIWAIEGISRAPILRMYKSALQSGLASSNSRNGEIQSKITFSDKI